MSNPTQQISRFKNRLHQLAGFKNRATIQPLITTCEIWLCVAFSFYYYYYYRCLSQFPVRLINGLQSQSQCGDFVHCPNPMRADPMIQCLHQLCQLHLINRVDYRPCSIQTTPSVRDLDDLWVRPLMRGSGFDDFSRRLPRPFRMKHVDSHIKENPHLHVLPSIREEEWREEKKQ